MKYLALLRGVNAGGKRRVPMAELRNLFEQMEFRDVTTYVNSGNLIFSARTKPDTKNIQKTLEHHFGFAIDTLIIDAKKFQKIVAAIPGEWQNDYTEHKSDACFLFPDVDSPDILERISPRPEFEDVRYVPGALLSYLPRKNQPKSALFRLASTPLYKQMTVRNITTARKLAELLDT